MRARAPRTHRSRNIVPFSEHAHGIIRTSAHSPTSASPETAPTDAGTRAPCSASGRPRGPPALRTRSFASISEFPRGILRASTRSPSLATRRVGPSRPHSPTFATPRVGPSRSHSPTLATPRVGPSRLHGDASPPRPPERTDARPRARAPSAPAHPTRNIARSSESSRDILRVPAHPPTSATPPEPARPPTAAPPEPRSPRPPTRRDGDHDGNVRPGAAPARRGDAASRPCRAAPSTRTAAATRGARSARRAADRRRRGA